MRALPVAAALLALAGVAATARAQEGASPEAARLRVVSYNAYGMPFSDVRGERLREAARRIAAMSPQLVAMQEVWVEQDAQAVRAVLAAGGLPHSASVASSAPAAVGGSGLLIASAWPIDDVRFTSFTLGRRPHTPWHLDWMSRKGVLRATVRAPWGQMILATTHMQADYRTASYQPVRIAQALQVADAIGALDPGSPLDPGATSRALPVVLAGDVNARFDDADFGVLLAAAALQPTAADCDLDAVLVRGGTEHDLRPVEVARVLEDQVEVAGQACLLSDHAALRVDLLVPVCGPSGCGRRAAAGVADVPAAASAAELAAQRAPVFRRAADVVAGGVASARAILYGSAFAGALALAAAVATWRRARRGSRSRSMRAVAAIAALTALYAAWLATGYAPHTIDGLSAVARRLELDAAAGATPHP